MGSPHDYLERCHSLAVLGGTFDPIHRGHLAIGEAVLRAFSPQRVLFMPCARPPHKEGAAVSDAEHRYQMALLATCGEPAFDVSRLELDRPGASYTIDTAIRLAEICPSGADICFVIGGDALAELLTWKNAGKLLELCRFIAVPRPGFGRKQTAEAIRRINARFGERIFLLDMRKLDISGTEIRRRFFAGESVRALLPRRVEDYARAHNLYRGPLSFDEARDSLKKRLSPKRFTHTMGVVQEAERLARHYHAPVEKARWAALLHDCAKEYGLAKKKALCERWGIDPGGGHPAQIDLTHGPLAAESARRDYGVQDPEILQAIRCHSTGHGAMTLLDKVVTLADYIEPYREDYPPLARMRALAYTDMDEALRVGIEFTIKEEEQAGNPVHPDGFAALDALEKRSG